MNTAPLPGTRVVVTAQTRTRAEDGAAVYEDCNTGKMLDQLLSADIDAKTKVQTTNAPA
jgi:hypothetical protein